MQIQNLMVAISQYKYFKLWIQQNLHKPIKSTFILFFNLTFCKPSKLQHLKYLIFDIKRFCRESNDVRAGLATINNLHLSITVLFLLEIYCFNYQ